MRDVSTCPPGRPSRQVCCGQRVRFPALWSLGHGPCVPLTMCADGKLFGDLRWWWCKWSFLSGAKLFTPRLEVKLVLFGTWTVWKSARTLGPMRTVRIFVSYLVFFPPVIPTPPSENVIFKRQCQPIRTDRSPHHGRGCASCKSFPTHLLVFPQTSKALGELPWWLPSDSPAPGKNLDHAWPVATPSRRRSHSS